VSASHRGIYLTKCLRDSKKSAFKDDKSYPYASRRNGRNFGFLPVHLTAFRSLWLFENAPRETVDLSCPPSERGRRQCATYPTDEREKERKRERERERTGVQPVMDVRYHHDIVGIFRAYLRSLQEAVRSRLFRARRILLASWNMPIYDLPSLLGLHCRVYQVM
jgi:hypothetical protein